MENNVLIKRLGTCTGMQYPRGGNKVDENEKTPVHKECYSLLMNYPETRYLTGGSRLTQVTTNLWLGNQYDAFLQRKGDVNMSFQVCLMSEEEAHIPVRYLKSVTPVYYYPIVDDYVGGRLGIVIDYVVRFLVDDLGKLLVFCRSGRSRSVAVCLGVLIKLGKFDDMFKADTYLQQRNWEAWIHPGLRATLQELWDTGELDTRLNRPVHKEELIMG